MPIIMIIVFSQLFGGAIMGNVKAYLPLVVPGILIQTLVMASGAAGTQLREDLDKELQTASILCQFHELHP
ncbi:Daunorubicin/doxorubicin resistance ABC transporter permease protein DrrB [Lactococcus lactis]|nr:Daunorubicin/doxorubicin resistance ABC transporter permease protein DrrB [Lactococcus lactis]